ncbi:MAG: hypothetical protein AAF798_20885 [Bacteroidota bacterium]
MAVRPLKAADRAIRYTQHPQPMQLPKHLPGRAGKVFALRSAFSSAVAAMG